MKVTGSPQLNKGRWNAILRVTDADGKQKQKRVALGLSEKAKKRDVKEAFQKVLKQYQESPVVLVKGIPFADWIGEYLKYLESEVEPNTMYSYQQYARTVIVPFYRKRGTILQEMRMRDVQAFYDYCVKERGVSASTTAKYRAVVRGALVYACQNELLANNPADHAKIPRDKRSEEERQIGKAYTAEQVMELLKVIRKEPIFPAVYLDLKLGLRRSEISGLQWDVVDFENKTITIRRSFVLYPEPMLKERTKTKSSYRVLPLSEETCRFLHQLQIQQKLDKLRLGEEYEDNAYICKFPNGKHMAPDYLTNRFRKVLKKYGLERLRFHDLRHTVATLMIMSDVSLKVVQEMLGHASLSTTANIYAHVDINKKREAVTAMEQALEKSEAVSF